MQSIFYQLVITIVLSGAAVLLLPRSCFLCMFFVAMDYETDVIRYSAWSSFLELGQVHYKQKNIIMIFLFSTLKKRKKLCYKDTYMGHLRTCSIDTLNIL